MLRDYFPDLVFLNIDITVGQMMQRDLSKSWIEDINYAKKQARIDPRTKLENVTNIEKLKVMMHTLETGRA